MYQQTFKNVTVFIETHKNHELIQLTAYISLVGQIASAKFTQKPT